MDEDERKAKLQHLFQLGCAAGSHAASRNTYSAAEDALRELAPRAAPVQRAGSTRQAQLVWAAGFVVGFHIGRDTPVALEGLEGAELDLLASALDVAVEGGWAAGRRGLQAELERRGAFVDLTCLLAPFETED
jgi:hypothetical protein